MELIAFVGEDKESWGQITGLLNHEKWDNVIIVKNKNVVGFPDFENVSFVDIDSKIPLVDLKNEILGKIKDRVRDFDVALSIASGTGKEHMALISAILSIPSGIRLVAFTKKGVEYIN